MIHDALDVFFAPFVLFVGHPWLALLPAATFVMAGLMPFRAHQREQYGVAALLLACGGAWALYAFYEWRMFLWSQTVIAPIRIDVFVIAPLLYLLTAVGLWGMANVGRQRFKTWRAKQ